MERLPTLCSPWAYPEVCPGMNRLRREGLLEIARAEVTRAAQATLARVHGDKSAPLIDFYSSLELAAEEWLARRDAAAAQAAKSAVFAPGKLPDV